MLREPSSVYKDDLTIPDSEILYRLVTPKWVLWEGERAVRPKSNAFQDQHESKTIASGYPAQSLSVFLSSVMEQNGITVDDVLQQPEWEGKYGMVSIAAEIARAQNQGIVRDPTESNPAHALVFTKSGMHRSVAVRKRLARAAQLVVVPPDRLSFK